MNLSAILLLFLHLLNESLGKRKYCVYTKNVYYSEATGGCKKCDPCFKGWGLVDEIEFEIDPIRGALGCRNCRECKDGTFQKRYKAFRSCKKCKICKPGEVEIQQCTNEQNRKCKKDKKDEAIYTPTSFQSEVPRDFVPTDSNPVARHQKASPAPSIKATTNAIVIQNNFKDYKVGFILTAVFVMVACTVLVVVLFGRYLGNRQKQRKEPQAAEQREQLNEDNNELSNEDNAETISTFLEETSSKTLPKTDEHTRDENMTNENIPRETLGNSQNQTSIPICKNIRPKDNNEKCESSLPLLASEFQYSLKTFQNISSLKQDKNEAVACRNCSEHVIEKMDNTQRNSTEVCPHGNIPTVVTEDYSDDISNDGSSLQRKEMLHEVMTPVELQNVAHHIAANSLYEKVGRVLGLSDNDIDIVKSNHTDVEDIAYNVLKKWTQKTSSSATKLTLRKALIHLGRVDIADLNISNRCANDHNKNIQTFGNTTEPEQ